MNCSLLTTHAIDGVVAALAEAGNHSQLTPLNGSSVEQLALEALALAGVDPRRHERLTGHSFENNVVKTLRDSKVGIRRTLHLDIWHKTDFRVTHLADKELAVPLSVQITLDWDNPKKMTAYKAFVQDQRHTEARLYVQVHRGVSAEMAATHIVDWVRKLQNKEAKRLNAIEILPEGSSLFRLGRRITTIEKKARLLEATRVVHTPIEPLEHLGLIVSIDHEYIAIQPDNTTDRFYFDLASVSSGRLRQLMIEDEVDEDGNIVTSIDRSRFIGTHCAFGLSSDKEGVVRPHDLVLLAG